MILIDIKLYYFESFCSCHQVVRAASPALLRFIILGALFIYSTVSKKQLWIE